jgi:cytochrome oxidase Cu insertion factor (SCO1/SenC/PrrC family)
MSALLVGASLLIATLFLAACSGSAATTTAPASDSSLGDVSLGAAIPESTPPPDGSGAPDFNGVDVMTGDPISLSQYRGTTVLLNFVNYGCSASLNQIVGDQLLVIKALADQRDDFAPLSVFCGCCPPEVLRDFAEQNSFEWSWLLDLDNEILRQYYDYLVQYGYPTLVLIDKDQRVIEVAGYTDLDTLDAMIDGLSQY